MRQPRLYQRVALLGRLSAVTEELEDIVRESSREDKAKILPRPLSGDGHMFLSTKRAKRRVSPVLEDAFREIVLQGLQAGRFRSESFTVGKLLGLSHAVRNLRQLKEVCEKAGLEVTAVKKPAAGRITLELKGGLIAELVSRAKGPVCYFEAGFLSGLFERWFGYKVNLREVRCRATKDASCKFESIEPEDMESAELSGRKGSLPLLPVEQYSEESVRLLTTLASHALTAIENALLFEKTKRKAIVDTLTGLYNYRYFRDSLRVEVKRAGRHHFPLSLIMMDVDRFKGINDNYGHMAGDEVLKAVAKTLATSVREIDIVARYGGDEFAIILPQTDHEGALVVAMRIRDLFRHGAVMGPRRGKIRVTLSIGVGSLAATLMSELSLTKAADYALLAAKRRGRGSVMVQRRSRRIPVGGGLQGPEQRRRR